MREQKSDESVYRFGYQGQFAEEDEETGWYHFELREYDAVIGRWLVPDPYGVHWSPYVAMNNSPMNAVDPDGGCENGDCQDLTFMNGDQNLVNEINFYAELAAIGPNAIVAFRQDLSLLLSSIFSFNPKLGVRFWGDGSFGPGGNIFKGRDWKPGMEMVDINVSDMNQILSFLQRSDLKRPRTNNTTLTAINPTIKDRADNVAEAILTKAGGSSEALFNIIQEMHAAPQKLSKVDQARIFRENFHKSRGKTANPIGGAFAPDSSYYRVVEWGDGRPVTGDTLRFEQ